MAEVTGGLDLAGVALVIGAVAAGIATMGGLVIQVLTFLSQARRDRKLEEMHAAVNGQSEALKKITSESDKAEGRLEGVAKERKNPMIAKGKA